MLTGKQSFSLLQFLSLCESNIGSACGVENTSISAKMPLNIHTWIWHLILLTLFYVSMLQFFDSLTIQKFHMEFLPETFMVAI